MASMHVPASSFSLSVGAAHHSPSWLQAGPHGPTLTPGHRDGRWAQGGEPGSGMGAGPGRSMAELLQGQRAAPGWAAF